MRKIILISSLVLVVFSLQISRVYAFHDQNQSQISKISEKEPEYAPGEIIIKLKESQAKEVLLDKSYLERESEHKTILSHLKAKYNLNNERPVFKSLHNVLKKTKLSLSQYKQKIKEKYPGRTKRIPAKLKKEDEVDLLPTYVVEVEEGKELQIIEKLKQDPQIEYAHLNYLCKAQMVPNDPYYSSSGSWEQPYDDLWGLKKLQCEQAWDISQGEGVVVAVIDSGIDYNHEDIAENIWTNMQEIPDNGVDDDNNGYTDDIRGWDFIGVDYENPYQDNDPMDGYGHGTHVAGTIAAVGNNNKGVIGVAPLARVMAVKALDDNYGVAYDTELVSGLIYAANNGADVLSNSWGGEGSSSIIEEAINYAYSFGCVVVAAAGNSNMDVRYFSPANLNNVITVAATDHNDLKWEYSNWGDKIDVAAPGGGNSTEDGSNKQGRNILSLRAADIDPYGDGLCIVGENYYRARGTSMACPHVSGVVASVIASQPGFTNEDVRMAIKFSADDLYGSGYDIYTGAGRINAFKALLVESVSKIEAKILNPASLSVYNQQEVKEVAITGTAKGDDFKQYELFYGLGRTPDTWIAISPPVSTPIENGLLGTWLIDDLSGTYLLRLVVTSLNEQKLEEIVQVGIENIKQISLNPIYTIASDPAISGNHIVWQDGRNWDNSRIDIYLYDLLTDTEQPVIISTVDDQYPDISGDQIVWHDFYEDIYLYDLVTDTKRQIETSDGVQNYPAIDNNRIVWLDNSDGQSSIYLYDLATDKKQRITNEDAVPYHYSLSNYVDISGNYIVWTDGRGYLEDPPSAEDIYLYDLIFGIEQRITTKLSDLDTTYQHQWNPSISGEKIVWEDYRNGNADIYLYDLSTNTEKQITSDPAYQIKPKISGHLIVWEDYRNGSSDIYFYDLVTGTEHQITTDIGYDDFPAVWANRVVWQGLRSDAWRIYLYEFKRPPDPTPPPTPIVNDEGEYASNPTRLSASWISEDPESDILEYQYQITQDSPAGIVIKDWASTVINSVSVGNSDLIGGRTYYFGVKAKNSSELWSGVGYSNGIIIIDTAPPTTPIVSDEGEFTNKMGELSASWIASEDAESGIVEYQYKITIDSPTSTAIIRDWTSVGTNTSVTATDLPSIYDGRTYYFGIKAKNGVGLWSEVGYSDGITIDGSLPTGSITINNGNTYTKSAAVTLTLSAADTGTGVSQMYFFNEDMNESDPEAYATTKSWTLTLGDGTKWVYVYFSDAVGNWSITALDTIILDTTKPTISNISDFPDPFDPEAGEKCKISFTLGDNLSDYLLVKLDIFTSEGGLVREYYKTNKPLGDNYTLWNGKDFQRKYVPDGVYKYRFRVKDKAGNYRDSDYYYVTKE